MALMNSSTRELTAKIVYFGPGLSGKTTNLKYLYENIEESMRGELLSTPADGERTILFDILPVEMGSFKGVKVRLQLYTVPGQVRREETRKTVLKGVDGIVFVADSQRAMQEANSKSFDQLRWHLLDLGLFLEDLPLVLQYNKRDLKDLLSIEELDQELNPGSTPFFEAVAVDGVGVEDTFKAIAALVLRKLVAGGIEGAGAAAAEPEALEETVLEESGGEVFQAEERQGQASDELPLMGGDDSVNMLLIQSASAPDPFFGEPVAAPPAASPGASVLEEEPTLPETPRIELPPAPAAPVQSASSSPVLRLAPGSPLEAGVEIGGKRYTLRIEIVPED